MDILERLNAMVNDSIGTDAAGEIRSLRLVAKTAKAEIERLRAERYGLAEEINRLCCKLAESQAREAGMREALSAAEDAIGNFEGYEPALGWIQDVIALPADHSALDTMLAQARADERERCAKIADAQMPESRESCPAHWAAYETMWGVREMVASQIATGIRGLK